MKSTEKNNNGNKKANKLSSLANKIDLQLRDLLLSELENFKSIKPALNGSSLNVA